MTHRQVFELAGWLAEHGAVVVDCRRGIPVAALRRYLNAKQAQHQVWSSILSPRAGTTDSPADFPQQEGGLIIPTLQEVATCRVLARVASTVLYSIGERHDVPLAMDAANRTARGHNRAAEAAMASVTIRSNLPSEALTALDRLGSQCDRLSDLLCGALLPHLNCDRFAVDRDRMLDFARTFGRRPALVRVPLRKALSSVPVGTLILSKLAGEAERALIECLPSAAGCRSLSPDPLADLTEMFAPRILRFPLPEDSSQSTPKLSKPQPLAFPAYSFAKLFRKKS